MWTPLPHHKKKQQKNPSNLPQTSLFSGSRDSNNHATKSTNGQKKLTLYCYFRRIYFVQSYYISQFLPYQISICSNMVHILMKITTTPTPSTNHPTTIKLFNLFLVDFWSFNDMHFFLEVTIFVKHIELALINVPTYCF